jgi:integrase
MSSIKGPSQFAARAWNNAREVYQLIQDSTPRFHDLRHVAATVGLAAGVDIKIMQEQLGHTTSVLTRNTYTTVIEELNRTAADAVAKAMKRKSA